jgi:hypothetical protein
LKIIFLSALGDDNNKFKALSPSLLKKIFCLRQLRFKFFIALADIAKSRKRQFSSLNHQKFLFFGLVPKSPTHQV